MISPHLSALDMKTRQAPVLFRNVTGCFQCVFGYDLQEIALHFDE